MEQLKRINNQSFPLPSSASARVRGVSGLRVADSSIMPEINSGNTMAAVVMIGEKAADLVKRDWGI